ncbi:MAG: RNA polymerase sigma factor [Bacteroidota bacterium]
MDKLSSFQPWCKRVMINTILDELKKKKRYQYHVQLSDVVQLENASEEVRFDENLGAQEIYLAIRSLPPQTASVFNLHAIDGYKHKEIAQMLGISEGTVKWHYSDARKRLQKLLSKKGYPEKVAS